MPIATCVVGSLRGISQPCNFKNFSPPTLIFVQPFFLNSHFSGINLLRDSRFTTIIPLIINVIKIADRKMKANEANESEFHSESKKKVSNKSVTNNLEF